MGRQQNYDTAEKSNEKWANHSNERSNDVNSEHRKQGISFSKWKRNIITHNAV